MEPLLSSQLLNGLIQADRKCQELLYKQFYNYGMSICIRYGSSREDGVEILNDAFLKVFQQIEKFDGSRPFLHWFRKILINTAINHYKKHLNHRQKVALEKIPELPDLHFSALEALSYMELIKCIQGLPAVYRTVFNLYVIEGFSHIEIAKCLGISVGTSKSNLHRARQKLRIMLTPRNHEEACIRNE